MSASDSFSSTAIGGRLCGSCTGCCTHLPIPAGQVSPGGKPAGVDCAHLCQSGCRIYSQRPQACVDFACAWLDDADWPEAWRPDRSGLLCLTAHLNGAVPAALVYEIRPRALSSRDAREILAQLELTNAIVVVVDSEQCRRRISGAWLPDAPHAAAAGPHSDRRPARSSKPFRRSAG
jgi:hypothetical protein